MKIIKFCTEKIPNATKSSFDEIFQRISLIYSLKHNPCLPQPISITRTSCNYHSP